MAKLLIDNFKDQININVKDYTALIHACCRNNFDMVQVIN